VSAGFSYSDSSSSLTLLALVCIKVVVKYPIKSTKGAKQVQLGINAKI
jgi:hypothetical protein